MKRAQRNHMRELCLAAVLVAVLAVAVGGCGRRPRAPAFVPTQHWLEACVTNAFPLAWAGPVQGPGGGEFRLLVLRHTVRGEVYDIAEALLLWQTETGEYAVQSMTGRVSEAGVVLRSRKVVESSAENWEADNLAGRLERSPWRLAGDGSNGDVKWGSWVLYPARPLASDPLPGCAILRRLVAARQPPARKPLPATAAVTGDAPAKPAATAAAQPAQAPAATGTPAAGGRTGVAITNAAALSRAPRAPAPPPAPPPTNAAPVSIGTNRVAESPGGGVADVALARRLAAQARVLELCRRLQAQPGSSVLLEQLRGAAGSVGDPGLRQRCWTAYGLGLVYVGRVAAPAAAAEMLRQARADSAAVDEVAAAKGMSEACAGCGGKGQVVTRCQACGSTGKCRVCRGAGKVETGLTHTQFPCGACRHTGICATCKGAGGRSSVCGVCRGSGQVLVWRLVGSAYLRLLDELAARRSEG